MGRIQGLWLPWMTAALEWVSMVGDLPGQGSEVAIPSLLSKLHTPSFKKDLKI